MCEHSTGIMAHARIAYTGTFGLRIDLIKGTCCGTSTTKYITILIPLDKWVPGLCPMRSTSFKKIHFYWVLARELLNIPRTAIIFHINNSIYIIIL